MTRLDYLSRFAPRPSLAGETVFCGCMKKAFAFLALSGVLAAASYEVAPAPGSQLALTVEKTGLYRGRKHLFLFETYRAENSLLTRENPNNPKSRRLLLSLRVGLVWSPRGWHVWSFQMGDNQAQKGRP